MKAYLFLGHAYANGIIDTDCHARIESANQITDKDDSYLMLCGGAKSTHPVTEAEQIAELMIWPKRNIIKEEYSTTTAENAWCSLAMLPQDVDHITIVCSRPHSFRARIFYKKAMKRFDRKMKMDFWYTPTVSVKSWLYEMRWLHHINKNVRQAEDKYQHSFVQAHRQDQ